MGMETKYFYPHVKAIDTDNRRITVCISNHEIDRQNERIEISAIAEALKGYAANPVVLGDHQHRLPSGESSVIGHSPPESFAVFADAVDVAIVFSSTKNAETYWINYRDGHQKAVSIGFIDLEWRFEEVDGRRVYVSTKIELLEISCVAVGANRGALIKVAGAFDRQADGNPGEAVLEKTKNTMVQAILDVWGKEFTELQRQIAKLTDKLNELVHSNNELTETVDELNSMLSGRDRFGEAMLGNASDQSGPAEAKIAELLEMINTLLTKFGE